MNDQSKTTGTVTDALRELIATDEAAAGDYLVESFLTSAMLALFHARRDAGLTQTQVAQMLHTKQSAIARLEADFSGGMSLRRFAEFALACGVLPFDLTLAPVEALRQFALTDPAAARTAEAVAMWRSTCQSADQQCDPCPAQLAERHAPTGACADGVAEQCAQAIGK